MKVIGRIAWDKEAKYWSPWVSFPNITAYRRWARDMRKVMGFRAKAQYEYVDLGWTAEGLLELTRGEYS